MYTKRMMTDKIDLIAFENILHDNCIVKIIKSLSYSLWSKCEGRVFL